MADIPVPGTVQLVDITSISTLQYRKSKHNIILIPQPTNNPNDPLNYSIWQQIWTFFTAIVSNRLIPTYLLIQEETGIPIIDLNTGNSLVYLFFRLGTLLTQPFALNFGSRPAAVISFFITCFLYTNYILISTFFSTIESLIELCITDTKLTHERGFYIGFYT
ncbi:unnamed protein product [Clonostachys rosea f. rosea IK726]|uniref:Uncharacterized protein n=1 Tax=Clonostachys rosea f. rosea IK726 TaxID=1349383 RepID=A0ACA9UQG5_BIOOC|nr:unnamed protein product [Clonostachys rosea f. rosea IK726]